MGRRIAWLLAALIYEKKCTIEKLRLKKLKPRGQETLIWSNSIGGSCKSWKVTALLWSQWNQMKPQWPFSHWQICSVPITCYCYFWTFQITSWQFHQAFVTIFFFPLAQDRFFSEHFYYVFTLMLCTQTAKSPKPHLTISAAVGRMDVGWSCGLAMWPLPQEGLSARSLEEEEANNLIPHAAFSPFAPAFPGEAPGSNGLQESQPKLADSHEAEQSW